MPQQYMYRVQPTRTAMLTEGPTENEARIVKAHFEYLQRLTQQGIVLTAARTLTADSDSFGIIIFEADSKNAAQALVNDDPAIRDGVMRAELFPCRVALWSDTGPGGSA